MSNDQLLQDYLNEIDPGRGTPLTLEQLIRMHRALRQEMIVRRITEGEARLADYRGAMAQYAGRVMIDVQELKHMNIQELAELVASGKSERTG